MGPQRRVRLLAALTFSCALLTGCASSVALASYPGAPPGGPDERGVLDADPVAWVLGEDRFAVALQSGSCVPTPTSVEKGRDGAVQVTFASSAGWFCTTSMGWHTFEFEPPATALDSVREVDVVWTEWPEESVTIPLE